jgi:hypothetical protein
MEIQRENFEGGGHARNDSRGSPVHVLGRDTPMAHPARQKLIGEFVSERLRWWPSPLARYREVYVISKLANHSSAWLRGNTNDSAIR